MPRTVSRNEELPKIFMTLVFKGLVTSTGNTLMLSGVQHPRMRLLNAAYTADVVGT